MKLYHCADARSFRCLWLIEELGLSSELCVMPFPPRRTTPGYLAVNPLGTIPFLVDGDTAMSESAAILQYLAVRYGDGALAVAPDEPDYGQWLDWLSYGEATLTTPQTITLRYRHLEEEQYRQPRVAEDYERIFLDRLKKADAQLAHSPYLCAGRFTAADISVGYALLLARKLRLGDRFPPAIAEYWSRLESRDGFRRAKARQKI